MNGVTEWVIRCLCVIIADALVSAFHVRISYAEIENQTKIKTKKISPSVGTSVENLDLSTLVETFWSTSKYAGVRNRAPADENKNNSYTSIFLSLVWSKIEVMSTHNARITYDDRWSRTRKQNKCGARNRNIDYIKCEFRIAPSSRSTSFLFKFVFFCILAGIWLLCRVPYGWFQHACDS